MRFSIYTITLLLTCLPTNAQLLVGDVSFSSKKIELKKDTILDHSRLECIYYHLSVDSELNQIREPYEILLIGKRLSRYGNYNRFRIDSVLNHIDKTTVTYKDYSEITYKYAPSYPQYLLKNTQTGVLEVHEWALDKYMYEDSVSSFNWSLKGDSSIICGHKCYKATCSFRGRKWEAWYATDIPISNGPWKFSGLPGLVLKAEDEKKEHLFLAISIRKGGNGIKTYTDSWEIKTTREKFNTALKDFRLNPRDMMQSMNLMPKNLDASSATLPNSRMFYNPIEKE